MARTQSADYEKRRQTIIDKAAQLFAKKGFLGTSVADLAKGCRTSKGLIYHYCRSKDDILHSVMASHIGALVDAAKKATAAKSNAGQRLRDLTHAFMALYVGAADRHQVLLHDLDNLPAPRRQAIVRQQRQLIGIVATLLRELQPGLNGRQSRAVVMLLFGMINWTSTWFDPKGALSGEDIADLVVDLLLGGLGATAVSPRRVRGGPPD
jgi:AcrR family transcriptional regulator